MSLGIDCIILESEYILCCRRNAIIMGKGKAYCIIQWISSERKGGGRERRKV